MHDAFRHHSRVDLPDRVASLLKTDAVRTEPRGGAITGDRWRVELADGREVFAKTRVGAPDGFFAVEADGLGWLADAAGGPPVPEVLAHDDEVLLLPWMREEEAAADAPERLGRELAALHSAGAASFGAERDGWIGAAGLDNRLAPDWPEFYADRRLDPYVRTLRERGELGAGEAAVFSRLTDRLEELAGPPEPPARLHGDLSSGNVLWSGGRRPPGDGPGHARALRRAASSRPRPPARRVRRGRAAHPGMARACAAAPAAPASRARRAPPGRVVSVDRPAVRRGLRRRPTPLDSR